MEVRLAAQAAVPMDKCRRTWLYIMYNETAAARSAPRIPSRKDAMQLSSHRTGVNDSLEGQAHAHGRKTKKCEFNE